MASSNNASDAREFWEKTHTATSSRPVSDKQRIFIRDLCEELGKPASEALLLIQKCHSAADASNVIKSLESERKAKAVEALDEVKASNKKITESKTPQKPLSLEDELEKRLKLRPESSVSAWTYDDFLEYFRKVTAADLIAAQDELEALLPNEGFAAAKRWLEIIENPSKMDKLYQARLAAQNKDSIMSLAVGDDDEAFYEALIRENVTKLEDSGNSTQEVARLSQIINVLRSNLREARARKPKKDSVLAKVLEAASETPKPASKRLKKPKTTRSKRTTKQNESLSKTKN